MLSGFVREKNHTYRFFFWATAATKCYPLCLCHELTNWERPQPHHPPPLNGENTDSWTFHSRGILLGGLPRSWREGQSTQEAQNVCLALTFRRESSAQGLGSSVPEAARVSISASKPAGRKRRMLGARALRGHCE